MISFETTETPVQTDLIRQPTPPAVLAEVKDLIPVMSAQVAEVEHKMEISSPDDLVGSESPLQLHIIMLPEAVAIVMAPKDRIQFFPLHRTHGIFRSTTPGGMSVIRRCQQRGFHPHNQPPDGRPIYKTCIDVYMNPSLKFDVIDLRLSNLFHFN